MIRRARQGGFTLTELLVSLVLGAFVVGGVLSVFVGGLETFRMTDSLSRMQETGRFALERMRRDLRQAGFVGCRSTLRQEAPRGVGALDPGLIRNTLNPAPAGGVDALAFEFDFAVPLMGYEATGDGEGTSWTAADPAVAAPATISLLTSPRDDSDVVLLTRALGSGVEITAHLPAGTGTGALTLAGDIGVEQGDIVYATDCLSGGIFEVTNATPGTSVEHTSGAASPGNHTPELGRSFIGGELFRIERAGWYVADNAVTGRPSLFRNDEEIAENVEQMQILYGVDTTFDARVNDYLTAAQIATNAAVGMDNVLAIRVELLINSGEEDNVAERPAELTFAGGTFTADADDRRLYRVFTTTVGVRNRVP